MTFMTHFGFSEVPLREKVDHVRRVFDTVSGRYDLMNDLMSMGIHRLWKRYAIRRIRVKPGDAVLDVAGGTGDLARLASDRMKRRGYVTVLDINANMLEQGRNGLTDKGYVSGVDWVQGDAELLPFPNNRFQAVTIGFGIRNVTRIDVAFQEILRVLRPGGQLMCLEFSQVAVPFLKPFYDIYSFKILPEIGQWVTKDRDAYQYLVESIRRFPDQESLKAILERCGFHAVSYHNLSAGIAAVHLGYKV